MKRGVVIGLRGRADVSLCGVRASDKDGALDQLRKGHPRGKSVLEPRDGMR